MIKVFTKNEKGKIEFTEAELENLLNEVFWEGYRSNKNYTWSSPYTNYPWYSTISTSNSFTVKSSLNNDNNVEINSSDVKDSGIDLFSSFNIENIT